MHTPTVVQDSAPGGRSGIVTDLEVMRALRERAPAPVPALELADALGLVVDCVPVRMRSLLSLGYVELLDGAYAAVEGTASDPPNDRLRIGLLGQSADRSPAEAARVESATRRSADWLARPIGLNAG